MAADFGHGYVASILLANGANVNIQDKVSLIFYFKHFHYEHCN